MKYPIIVLSVFMFFLNSCKTEESSVVKKTSPEFRLYKGKAEIVSIKSSPVSGDDGNNSYMMIYFNFVPSDPGAKKNYQFPEAEDANIQLKYDNRNSFHKNWIMKWGLKIGNEYPATRYEAIGKISGVHVYYDVELSPSNQVPSN